MGLRLLSILAVLATALALTPTAAHLYAMPNKIGLSEAPYFTVQAIYSGWWVLGLLWVAALVADAALAVTLRAQGLAFWLAGAATALIVVVFEIFLIWTQSANSATANGTTVPPNWQALRVQWECSHAVNAGLLLFALCCVSTSAVLSGASVKS